jgi:hypothetical protein
VSVFRDLLDPDLANLRDHRISTFPPKILSVAVRDTEIESFFAPGWNFGEAQSSIQHGCCIRSTFLPPASAVMAHFGEAQAQTPFFLGCPLALNHV